MRTLLVHLLRPVLEWLDAHHEHELDQGDDACRRDPRCHLELDHTGRCARLEVEDGRSWPYRLRVVPLEGAK